MIISNSGDIKIIREGGKICKSALDLGISLIKPGISTLEINNQIEKHIRSKSATPSFLNYDAGDGPYPYSCCISLNHELVHTLPSSTKIIKRGDLVTIDVGVKYKGFHTDSAWTIEVETKAQKHFLQSGVMALEDSITKAVPFARTGAIATVMQKTIESAGYNVSRDLAGHGIGRKLHEEPQILCYGKEKSGEVIQDGMLLAVEIMYMKGNYKLVIGSDNFSIDTKDYSLSAQFEHTILVRQGLLPEIIV